MKRIVLLVLTLWLVCPSALRAQADTATDRVTELEKKLEALEQRYRALERKLELEKDAATTKSKSTPLVSVGASGFTLQSADTNFVLKLRGLLQVDSRSFFNDGGINNNDTFLLRRARPILEGTLWRDFDFLLVPEFGGSGSPSILDAYLNYRFSPGLQFRVGKFKQPVGLEQLQSDSQAFFIERGLPTNLLPNRDLGVQLHGEIAEGVASYALGVFNGVGDNRNTTNVDFDDEKDVAGRVFFQPFLKSRLEPLHGLGVGVAGSFGNREGAAGLPANNGFGTTSQQTFFAYRTGAGTNDATANVTADGDQWRVSPQAYYYCGPFGLLGEYALSSQQLRRAAGAVSFGTIDNTAWQVAGSWVITGEKASYRGVVPLHPFRPTDGAWGAFEVVARFGSLRVEDAAFPAFANPANSAARATAWGLGLNWFLNRNLRAAVNYEHTGFRGGDTGVVTRQDENAVLTRLQLAF